MADYDIYPEQLLSLNLGYALYEPDPATGMYDYIRVGDVGYVEYGAFKRMFNVYQPNPSAEENDDGEQQFTPVNSLGVPEGFEPLPPMRMSMRNPLSPGSRYSTSVRTLEGDLEVSESTGIVEAGAKVSLHCSNKRGAALLTKHPAYREDAENHLHLRRCMLKNYPNWLAFARNVLDRDIQLRDLVLVTGRDLTADWATATVTENITDCRIDFEAGASLVGSARVSFWGNWNTSASVPHRCGPMPLRPPGSHMEALTSIRCTTAHTLETPVFNQCIFIRGYRVQERLWRPPKIIKAAAGPDDLAGNQPDPSTTVAVLSRLESGNSSDGDSASGCKHDAYDVVLEYMLDNTNAQVAIIHDEDLMGLTANLDTLTDFERFLHDIKPKVAIDDFGDQDTQLSVASIMKWTLGQTEGTPLSEQSRMSVDHLEHPSFVHFESGGQMFTLEGLLASQSKRRRRSPSYSSSESESLCEVYAFSGQVNNGEGSSTVAGLATTRDMSEIKLSASTGAVATGADRSQRPGKGKEHDRIKIAKDHPLTTQNKDWKRVMVTCEHCSSRKIRCDGAVPACLNCQRRQCECVYDAVPKQLELDRQPGTHQLIPRHVRELKRSGGVDGEAERDIQDEVNSGDSEKDVKRHKNGTESFVHTSTQTVPDFPHGESGSTSRPPADLRSHSGSFSAKGGCWTCRLRRKKCDEQRVGDSCQTCIRLRIDCLGWGLKRPDWMRDKPAVEAYKAGIKVKLISAGMIRGQPRSPHASVRVQSDESKEGRHSGDVPSSDFTFTSE